MKPPKMGDVFIYDYLWFWQHDAGETEGRKPRPTALVATVVDTGGKTNLFILAITSTAPPSDRQALEVPQIERRRAGLEDDKKLWIMLDEYNHDILEGSFYFNSANCIGQFSETFYKLAFQAFMNIVRTKRTKQVKRTE